MCQINNVDPIGAAQIQNPYTAGLKGEYKFQFSLVNGDDEVLTDNLDSGMYFVDKRNDIKVYQLLFPTVDTILDANELYVLKASIINLGDADRTQPFSITMQIFEDAAMIYNSNIATSYFEI